MADPIHNLVEQSKQPISALNFNFSLPQIGNQIFVALDVTDDTQMLAMRITLAPDMMRALAQSALKAVAAAEKTLVKPQSSLLS